MPRYDWTEMNLTQKWCEEKLVSSIVDLVGLETVPCFLQAICCKALEMDEKAPDFNEKLIKKFLCLARNFFLLFWYAHVSSVASLFLVTYYYS